MPSATGAAPAVHPEHLLPSTVPSKATHQHSSVSSPNPSALLETADPIPDTPDQLCSGEKTPIPSQAVPRGVPCPLTPSPAPVPQRSRSLPAAFSLQLQLRHGLVALLRGDANSLGREKGHISCPLCPVPSQSPSACLAYGAGAQPVTLNPAQNHRIS